MNNACANTEAIMINRVRTRINLNVRHQARKRSAKK